MSRINTNVGSLIAQRILAGNNNRLTGTLERLSTGLRVNRGKDDPAGLIASENLRSEKTSISAAIGNADRADQIVSIAEGGLQEISGLLTELQGLLTTTANSAGLSAEEKEANQLQIDSVLQTIDRIADATTFQGTKLLNGNFDFTTSNVNTGVTDFRVNGAKLGSSTLTVQAVVTTSAQQGGLYLSTGSALNLGGSGQSFTFEVTGATGSRQFQFASGTTTANVVAAINAFSDVTGVAATVRNSGTSQGINLRSSDFGSSEFVTVKVINSASIVGSNTGVYNFTATDQDNIDTATNVAFTASAATNGIRDAGQDIAATINGVAATASGKTVRVNTDFLDVELTFSTSASQTQGSLNAFDITGGGATFQLAGSVNVGGKVGLGVSDVSARKLGNSSVGLLSSLASGKSNNIVNGNITQAQKVVSESIRQISSTRGRLGAFQKNTVGATIRSLNVALENTAAAESLIRDADFATETAQLTRSQILVSAATNVLALANSQPQSALQLLG